MSLRWSPAMCERCHALPAVMGRYNYQGEGITFDFYSCWECGTPCGEGCCGVDASPLATLIIRLWAMRTGKEIATAWFGFFEVMA